MKSFTEFYEEQETLSEGFFDIVGKILGFGAGATFSAWAAALIIKGGIGAINSIANSFGKRGIEFKRNFKEETKESKAVKNQLNHMEEKKNKYIEFLGPIIESIKVKNWEEAVKDFNELPIEKKNSFEVKQVIVEEIIKVTKSLPVAEPTPGNETYRVIKKFFGLAVAKAIAKSIQDEAQSYIVNK